MTDLTERSWTTKDRTGWAVGPWSEEPDKVQWVDGATDLDCLAVRNRMGVWCGYVGLPPGHPLHGKDYDEVDPDVDVHGGLTFAGSCDEAAPEGHGICHVPAPGRPGDVWWLGFDTGHAFDRQPGLEAELARAGVPSSGDLMPGSVYRTLDYVRGECAGLARQLAATSA